MNKIKSFFLKAADMFGFKKSSKYVSDYLNRANMRSGIFMAAIIFILEIWLVIRQFSKYILDVLKDPVEFAKDPYFNNVFRVFFAHTSYFWLLMAFGLAMFFYCIYYSNAKKQKWLFWASIISAGVSLVFVSLVPLEFIINHKSISFSTVSIRTSIYTGLRLGLYVSIFLFDVTTIVATIYTKHGGKNNWINSVLVVIFFALVCLVFGVMVSFGDFSSTAKFKDEADAYIILPDKVGSYAYEHKQIICFLMMSIYVGCLLIWKPYVSFGILGSIFLGFYLLIKNVMYWQEGGRQVPEGDEVNYITFFISLTMICISIYDQRISEGRKDERLERLAKVDELTGLMTYNYFLTECDKAIKEDPNHANNYAFLFFNITSFKIYNDQKGYIAGNEFLKTVGEIITEAFPDAFVSRQADDHYVAFVRNEDLINKFDLIRDRVRSLDKDIKPNITIGYNVVIDDEEAKAGVEKARYANSALKGVNRNDYFQYDAKMHDHFNLVQYIVSNVDDAVEKGWIVAYYQPVVYSRNGKLCGVEALARWIDPKYGFLNPGVFITALEDAHLAYKVDLAMLEIVCKNMRRVLDEGGKIVPTSINFSRGDFSLINIPEEVIKITKKYRISPEFLHVEVTESALLEEKADLPQAMRELRKNGFAVWLDDFGSGYSSFNAIKDYAFDVVKLDMEFLKGFDKNEKSKPVIDSVIKMSDSVGMGTLCEGVETKEQMEFLKKIGCQRLQGYLFSKPIPYEELNKMIAEKKLIIAD